VESLRAQTFTDWELIVVGDACTDDTEDVVRSFDDARIRFVNRAQNFGEQSAPNNDGVALARGRFIAFLNHDDLWLPEHLETCLAAIDDADLVFTEPLLIGADGLPVISGMTANGRYEPWTSPPASSWLFRRELAAEIGPWAAARSRFAIPSQEWLYRAWRRGKKLIAIPRVTLVAILSGWRRGSYSERQVDAHAHWASRLPFIKDEIAAAAIRAGALNHDGRVFLDLARAAKGFFRRVCMTFGVHPQAIRNALVYRRRGGAVTRARITRGLDRAHGETR